MAAWLVKWGIGGVAVLIGLGIIAGAVLRPDLATAPVWVVEAAGGAFLFAGLSFTAQAFGRPTLARVLSLPVVYLLAVPGLAIMFGDGQCSVSGTVMGLTGSGQGEALGCRIVFGIGALLTLAAAIGFTVAFLRRGRRPADLRKPPGAAI